MAENDLRFKAHDYRGFQLSGAKLLTCKFLLLPHSAHTLGSESQKKKIDLVCVRSQTSVAVVVSQLKRQLNC